MQDSLILKAEKTFALSKPAFILLLISVILTAILAVATVRNVARSQKLMELSLLRQGRTMIHAFEAGTRTSMLFRKSTGHNPLLDLTTEVLKDTGIAYIRIIDEDDAVIVSEGNVPQSILKKYSALKKVENSPVFSTRWSDNIFEISKQFHPVVSSPDGMSMMELRWEQWHLAFKPKGQMYISVGFYTNEYEETRQEDMYHTIFMLVMLLLLFFAGSYFLFLYQRMRVTHATLLNTQLYTNNVLESIPDSLITLDKDGGIVSCNKNAGKLFKCHSTDIVGSKLLDIFPDCPPETLNAQGNVIEKDAELLVAGGDLGVRRYTICILAAVILCLGEQITPRELPPRLLPDNDISISGDFSSRGWTLRDMEREMIRATLQETNNNKSLAAKNLGIARQTLINKIKEYNV